MITRYVLDNQEVIELSNNSGGRVSIIKSLGGTVYNLEIAGKSILFHDKTHEITKNDLFRGRMLFPFNDRIPEGKYQFNGEEYVFPLNCDEKDSIHGLIYNREMDEVIINDGDEPELILTTTTLKGEFPGYPFCIKIDIHYKLLKDHLLIDFTVENRGEEQTPFALGWHPYFTFGHNIDSSTLKFDSVEYYDVNENLYYEGHHYPVSGTDLDFTEGLSLEGRELDIAIKCGERGLFELSDGEERITMEFDKKLFPALQLFIPEDRLSIAVEPITAPSDTFNYPDTGLIILEPGQRVDGGLRLSYQTFNR